MTTELITVEYAGPASRQVGNLPCYDVRAWWTVVGDRTAGNVKRAASRELKRHVAADHVEFVSWDVGTYNSPRLDAMITFRVLTAEQFADRRELRARVYTTCDECHNAQPGYVVLALTADETRVEQLSEHEYTVATGRFPTGDERALCHSCWHPIRDTCKVLHWINRNGRVQI